MSTRWTQEQFDAWQRRHGAQCVAAVPAANAATAMLRSDAGSPTKAEVKAEKELHGLISQELRRREIRFLHADMRKSSTLPVGHPDYTIFLPGGRTIFAEIKTGTGRLAPHQEAYIKALEADGFEVWVPRSFEIFRDFLRLALEKTR